MPFLVEHTVVVGAGAVGSFFGAMLARAGHQVHFIGRPAYVEAVHAHGLELRMHGTVEHIAVEASSDLAAVRDASVVLFCVKSMDTESVARSIAPLLSPGCLVLDLQNGIENAVTLARHISQPVVPAAVYVAAAMPRPGVVVHHGRGDLIVGAMTPAEQTDPVFVGRMQTVAAMFETAGVPVRVSPDVHVALWNKLVVNCAFNAISAVSQRPYGRMAAVPQIQALQRTVVEEVIQVARADGHALDLTEALENVERTATAMATQVSSTAQDLARGRTTEIDDLNGFIVRRGAALGIPTPANQALHALVKLLESRREDA